MLFFENEASDGQRGTKQKLSGFKLGNVPSNVDRRVISLRATLFLKSMDVKEEGGVVEEMDGSWVELSYAMKELNEMLRQATKFVSCVRCPVPGAVGRQEVVRRAYI